MNLEKLSKLAENLRKNVVGDPEWVKKKHVFEYPEETIEVVIILKLLRAIQGIKSQLILCNEGLFIDMGSLYRCVNDCVDEIRFLLEKYPEQSKHAMQFIKNFFEHTIDNTYVETHSVSKNEIQKANVRFLTNLAGDGKVKELFKKIHKTFCGYTHANYAHIMQSYGGFYPKVSFNLLGVPSKEQKTMQMQIVEQSYISILNCMLLICLKLKQNKIAEEVKILRNELNNP